MTASGDLNRRITLLQSVTVKSQSGAPETQWTERQTVWAKFKPLTGKQSDEQFKDGREATSADAEFTIRRSSEVLWLKPKDRVSFDGKIFELVTAPAEIGFREFLQFNAKLRDANNGRP